MSLNRDNSAGTTNFYKSPVETIGYLAGPYASTYSDTASSTGPSPSGPSRLSGLEPRTAIKAPLELHHEEADMDTDCVGDESEGDDSRFVNFPLLSHNAVRLKDQVRRGTHIKGRITYPKAFTGKDIVVSSSSSNY